MFDWVLNLPLQSEQIFNTVQAFLSSGVNKRLGLKSFNPLVTQPTNCLSVFDHFVRLALKELTLSISSKLQGDILQITS